MNIILHQTNFNVADFNSALDYLKNLDLNPQEDEIHIFPELFTTGYPLQDIVLQKSFIQAHEKMMKYISDISKEMTNTKICLLIGGLKYSYLNEGDDIPSRIENVIYKLIAGAEPEAIYTKMLLPNYDIFGIY